MDHPPFLRSLEIAGFKSFARPTRLEFPAGITALVGPNGSGKSNVVDAIRWCLGEQNVRDLRGQRAEDVIYAGPRRLLGAAEVTLTFSAPAGIAAPQSWSELSVARRLYRSGESEYLLNRERVRLRDVSGALHDLGVGSVRHVVVTQGMADALLSATAGERRGLFEQAAGLSGYRERREEARQKLVTTQHNIETIAAVLAELEPRVRLLRRQARAVVERDEAAQRLRSRLRDWYAARWQEAAQRVQEISQRATVLGGQRRAGEDAVRRLEEEAEGAIARERAWQHQVEAVAAALHGTERDRDASERAVQQLIDRLREHQSRIAEAESQGRQLDAAQQATENRRRAVLQELTTLDAQQRALSDRTAAQLAEEKELRQQVEVRRREAAARAAAHEQARRGQATLASRAAELQSRHQDQAQRLERTVAWLAEADAVEQTLTSQLDELQRGAAARRQALVSLHTELGALQQASQQAQHRLDRVDRLRRRAHSTLQESRRKLGAAKRELDVLQGAMGDEILLSLRVEPGWEQAVAVALGEWASVSPGSPSLHLHAGGEDDFLPWRETLAAALPGESRWADQVVEGWPAGLLNPLAGTLLVNTEDQATDLWPALAPLPGHTIGSPPLQVVTRSGHCWNAVGVRSCRPDDRAARYLACRRRVEEWARRVTAVGRRLTLLDDVHAAGEAAVAEARSRERALSDQVERATRALAELRAGIGPAARQLEAHRGERERYRAGETQERVELDQLRAELRDVQEDLQRATADVEEAARRSAAARDAAQRVHDRLTEVARCLSEARQQREIVAARQEAQRQVLRSVEGYLDRLQAEAARVQDDLAARQERVGRLEPEIEAQRIRLRELTAVVAEQEQRLTAVRRERPDLQGQGESQRRARQRLGQIIAQHEHALAALDQVEDERRRLRGELHRELGGDTGNLTYEVTDPPSDDEIRRLRLRAAQYADADPSVVGEARELGERQLSLREHVADLSAASDNLRGIMTVADREMHQRFETAVSVVGEEFARVFRMMLRGGDARLEQVDDGGVEIRVTLPGRRTRSSAAFSGGERSLVATALLFGVLKTRPTPFCILDEVDAALDESNVDRYLAVLRELSERTQMIVVTHQRATMAAADVLYGMTLDDEGVSTPLSLRLDAFGAAG